jgi:hypothetical protein
MQGAFRLARAPRARSCFHHGSGCEKGQFLNER